MKIYKVVGHKAKKKHLNKEMYEFVSTNHPEIGEEDIVEIEEYRSIEVKNTWKE